MTIAGSVANLQPLSSRLALCLPAPALMRRAKSEEREGSSRMTRVLRSFSLVLLCLVSVLAGCAGGPTEGPRGDKSAAVQRLPANYRQLMAQYVAAHWISAYPIRSAKISQPHPRPAGLFSSSVVPAVCVIAFRDNPLGQIVGENYIMTIEGGRVRELPRIDGDSCIGWSTFHELPR
jgi:hypothetical protein